MKSFKIKLIFSLLLFTSIFTSCENILSQKEESYQSDEESQTSSSKTSSTTESGSSTSSSSTSGSTSSSTSTSGTSSTSSSDTGTSATETGEVWEYTYLNPLYELSSSTKALTISGLAANQKIFLSKVNPTAKTIAAKYTQYVSSANNITLSQQESNNTSTGTEASGSFPEPGSHRGPGRHHFIPASISAYPAPEYSTSRSATTSTDLSIEQIEAIVGSSKKDLYIDTDSTLSSYKEAGATLRAKGKYCYVWVIDGYYEDDSSGSYQYTGSKKSYTPTTDEKVSEENVLAIAEKFDAIYPVIRNIFGNESDQIYYSYENSDFTSVEMEKLSDTGSVVNIVIYDIGDDHSESDSSGVLGYFYAKDYYPNNSHLLSLSGMNYSSSDSRYYSNEGKYFYIDAYYTQTQAEMMLSTIAHEFQHMINWGVKYMEQDIDCSTEFNEMLSMLCEDLMQEYLGISNSDSPKARLPMFEKCYSDCGLEYRSDSTYLQVLSYAANYAFGCWIARQFGGAEVISQMSKNAWSDCQAIVNAVNTVNGSSYSIEDLLKMYSLACLIDNPSFNISTSLTSSSQLYYKTDEEEYAYPLSAIDLWNLKDSLQEFYESLQSSENSSYYKFDGPQLYGYNAQKDLRPYGMTLVEVGSVNNDGEEVTISFGNSSPSEDEKVYLIIN